MLKQNRFSIPSAPWAHFSRTGEHSFQRGNTFLHAAGNLLHETWWPMRALLPSATRILRQFFQPARKVKLMTEHRDRLRSTEARYLLAIALVLTALLVRGPLLGNLLGRDAPLMIFILAVTVSSIYGGFGPGVLATFLSMAVGLWFFIERDGFVILKLSDRVRIGVFLVE